MTPQHIVIVGGSSGIGLATASLLLSKGHKVTITGRNISRLEAAQDTLSGNLHIQVMDATDAESLPAAFDHLKPFDHLVLALGSGKGVGPFASTSIEEVKAGFEEKVYAHFAAAQAALPFINRTGSLTFISAVTAIAAMPGTAGIGAANAAVNAFVPILAAELRPLRVNGVSPGVIDTPWWNFLDANQKSTVFADFSAKTPVGRVGTSEDVAETIVFLIKNSFISGHTIVCDGGLQWAH